MVFYATKKNAILSKERDKKFPEEQLNASFPTKFVWLYATVHSYNSYILIHATPLMQGPSHFSHKISWSPCHG